VTPRVSTVVFDVGNVLVHWDIRKLYASLIADPAELDYFCTHVVTPDWHFQHDAGRPVRDTVPELMAQFPQYRDLIALYDPRWMETVGPDVAGMAKLIADLDAARVPMFAITNFSIDFWPRFVAATPMIAAFRDVIVSGAHAMVKPDPAIYALALKRFRLMPETAIFIDDRAENVDAASANGFIGYLFQSAEKLRVNLISAGIAL
jgi:2-haloacid dehalogenase